MITFYYTGSNKSIALAQLPSTTNMHLKHSSCSQEPIRTMPFSIKRLPHATTRFRINFATEVACVQLPGPSDPLYTAPFHATARLPPPFRFSLPIRIIPVSFMFSL